MFGSDDISDSFRLDGSGAEDENSIGYGEAELTSPGDVSDLVVDLQERGRGQARPHLGSPPHPHHHDRNHDSSQGIGGLNASMAIRFDLGDSHRSEGKDDKTPAPAAAHVPNFKDYLKAQCSMKMKSFRHHGSTSRNLSSQPSTRHLNVGPEQSHPALIPEGEDDEEEVKEESVHTKQVHAIAAVGRRHSMIQDSAAWQSFMHEVEAADDQSTEEEEGYNSDEDGGGVDHHHHHHGDVSIPFYCVPVQRQRWGDDQMLPHINWGDIFFDLFYVAAAYNLGVLLISTMNEEDWPRGIVYFIGIFGPLYHAWENDMYYSSRYTVVDHFHRLFDVLRFLLVASVVLHIKSFDFLSDTSSVETFALMASTTLEAIMTLLLNVELVLYADGDRIAIVNHTMRKITHQYIPMVLVYATATAVAATFYFQHDEESGYDASSGYGDDSYGSDYNSNKTDYPKDENSTYGVDYDIYNTTGALDGGFRGLAAAEDDYPSYDSGETVWKKEDVPYIICCSYYLLELGFTALRKLSFSRDVKRDIREHFVPNNIDYLIHRYGEWTMLMIGESVLSLLIVDTAESKQYYTTAYLGVLTVILLQILKFESEPSHSDGHALWRSMEAAVCFSLLIQILSIGLIAFGVSYKVTLTIIAAEAASGGDYDDGCSTYNDDAHRLLAGGESCPGEGRRLAGVPAITNQASAAVFCSSLSIILISLEFMLLTHAGVKKNYRRLFKRLEHNDWKHVDFPLLFIGLAKVMIILFTATMSQWETDPTTITVMGFFIVSAFALSRVVCWGLVHKNEEIKRFMSLAKKKTSGAALAAVKKSASIVHHAAAAAATAASIGGNSRHSEAASITDHDKVVWDTSFDAIVVTDPSGVMRHVNQTCLQIFGYEEEKELIGHNVTKLVGGGESDHHANYLEDFRKSTKTSSTIGKQRTLFSRRKDGTEFPCIVGIKQMPDSDDLIGYIRNTTGLNADHTNDAKILDPVQRLMDDTSFDAILATTKEGEIIDCNMTALSELGYYHKDDLIGKNISVVVGGGHAAKHDKYMDRFQKKKKTETMLGKQRILRARRENGSEFECLIRINTIEETDGLLVGYIRNIDGASRKQRRRHADEMSAQSRSSSRNQGEDLIDESFDSIIVADEIGTIQRVNLTALEMFRYDQKDELVGQNLSLLVGGGMADKHDMYMKRFAEAGKTESKIGVQRVLKALRKDRTEFKCIIGIKKMKNSNMLVGYVRDVSDLDALASESSVKITNLNVLDPVERLVDDESFDAIIIIDYSGIMKRVNATAVKEFGYSSKDELEGKNVSILVGGGMAGKHDNFVKRFRESGVSSSTIGKQRILLSKRKDGTEFPSILGIRQIPDTEYLVGHLKNMTGLSKDDRQTSIQNLDILKHVDDTSFDSIVIIKMDGSIVQVNETAVSDFSYDSKGEMTSLNISALVGGGEAKNHDKYLEKFEKSGREGTTIGKRRRLLAKRKDGTEFACIVGIKKLPGTDYLIGYLSNVSES